MNVEIGWACWTEFWKGKVRWFSWNELQIIVVGLVGWTSFGTLKLGEQILLLFICNKMMLNVNKLNLIVHLVSLISNFNQLSLGHPVCCVMYKDPKRPRKVKKRRKKDEKFFFLHQPGFEPGTFDLQKRCKTLNRLRHLDITYDKMLKRAISMQCIQFLNKR